jgi:hypothetical protein
MLAEHVANKSMSVQHYAPIISAVQLQHRHDRQGFSNTLINGRPSHPNKSPKSRLGVDCIQPPTESSTPGVMQLGRTSHAFLFAVALRWLELQYWISCCYRLCIHNFG